MRIRSSDYIVLTVLVILIYSSKFIFMISPNLRIWGIDHLKFLPSHYTLIYACLFLLLGILLFKKLNSAAGLMYDGLSGLFGDKRQLKWALVSLFGLVIFWIFRMPTNFLGDGYAVINNIGNDLPVVYKWTEIGVTAVAVFINKLLPYSGLEGATYAYAVMSVISGTITFYFFCGISYELTGDKSYRLFILCTLIFSGWSLLFFGYAENYPLLWASMTGYLYFATRYMNKKCSLFLPLSMLLLSHAIHLQSLFFAISFPLLLISRNPVRQYYIRYKKALLSIAAIIVLSGTVFFFYQYSQSLGFRAHFLPLLDGKPPSDHYALLSIPHISDILNQYSLLIPLWPIFVYLFIKSIRGIQKDAVWYFLASFSIGGLALILILDPRLGMGRDWDLFALCGLGPALFLLKSIEVNSRQLAKFYPAFSILGLLLVAPYFLVNLQFHPSIDYFNSLMSLDREKSKSGMGILRDYYSRSGNAETANRINAAMWSNFPNLGLIEKGQEAIQSGNTDKAISISAEVIKNEPYSTEGYALRGTAYMLSGNYDEAAENLRKAVELEPYNSGNHMNLGLLAFRRQDYVGMMQSFRDAQAFDPDNHFLNYYIGNGFYVSKSYDSALVYYEKVIIGQPDNAEAFKMAGFCAYYTKDKNKTNKYLSHFLKARPDSPQRDECLRVLEQIQ